jgi:3-phenylpropionate/trans-cinnamate dioxygenase ferredoxin subunit
VSDAPVSTAIKPAGDGFERVAKVADVPRGGMLGVVTPAGERVCLVDDGGVIRAVGDECPHQGFALSSGELLGNGTIECVWHGARFDCRSGAVVRGPAEETLPVFETRVAGGEVFVGPRVK